MRPFSLFFSFLLILTLFFLSPKISMGCKNSFEFLHPIFHTKNLQAGTVIGKASLFRREKLIYREVKFVKKFTGITFGRNCALVLRNAEINHGDEKLYLSFQSYYCEKPDSYKNFSHIFSIHKVLVKHRADALGHGIYICFSAAATAVCALRLHYLCAKSNGVHYFCVCQRLKPRFGCVF